MITLKIEGAEKALRKFKRIPPKLAKGINTAIRKSIFQIEGDVKPLVPVDTGRLRASIGGQGGGKIFKNLYGALFTNVKYASWIHEGKMRRNGRTIYIKGMGKARTPVGGKPFMKLGVKKAEPEIERYFKKEIDKAIK